MKINSLAFLSALFMGIISLCCSLGNEAWLTHPRHVLQGSIASGTMGGAWLKLVLPRIRDKHDGAEHSTVQQQPKLQPNNNGGRCNPSLQHLDLAEPAFLQIAQNKAGILPINFRRVACAKKGGILLLQPCTDYRRRRSQGGDIHAVSVIGTRMAWLPMSRIRQSDSHLIGQSLLFKVTKHGANFGSQPVLTNVKKKSGTGT